jgi:hypothetical protein
MYGGIQMINGTMHIPYTSAITSWFVDVYGICIVPLCPPLSTNSQWLLASEFGPMTKHAIYMLQHQLRD